MGKRLTQQQLLAEFDQRLEQLNQVLASLTARQWTQRGRNEDDWSIKTCYPFDRLDGTRATIAHCSDEELTTLNYYAWTGNSWTLSDYFRASTAAHFHWATKKIKKWLRESAAG